MIGHLLAEPLRPRWSTGAVLVYIGGLVALAATGTLLGILGEMHGDRALVGYGALATVGALGLALLLQYARRDVAAGLAATLGVIFFTVFVGAVMSAVGLAEAESEGYDPAVHVLEAAMVVAALLALARFRAPLLVLLIALTVLITVLDLASELDWDDAVTAAALVVGALLAAAGVAVDRSGREPYGFWLHLVGGAAVGWAVVDLLAGDARWILVGAVSLAYVAVAYLLGRSSYAVLGAIGILATTTYFTLDVVSFATTLVPFAGEGTGADVEPWQVAAWFIVSGLVIGLLGLVGERLRAPWRDRDDPRRDRDELAPDA